MFESVNLLENKHKVWAYTGLSVTSKEWEDFKDNVISKDIEPILEGMDFPVSKELYLKNKDKDNWLP